MRPIQIHRRRVNLPTAVVPEGTYNTTVIDPADASITITFNSDGTWTCTNGANGTWKFGGGVGGDFEIKWQSTSGSLNGGTENTYEALSANRGYLVQRTIVGTKSCTGNVTIRRVSDGALFSGIITLNAIVDV